MPEECSPVFPYNYFYQFPPHELLGVQQRAVTAEQMTWLWGTAWWDLPLECWSTEIVCKQGVGYFIRVCLLGKIYYCYRNLVTFAYLL